MTGNVCHLSVTITWREAGVPITIIIMLKAIHIDQHVCHANLIIIKCKQMIKKYHMKTMKVCVCLFNGVRLSKSR